MTAPTWFCSPASAGSETDGVALRVSAVRPTAVNTLAVQVEVEALRDLGAAVIGLAYSGLTLTDVQGVAWTPGDRNLVLMDNLDAGETAAITLVFAPVSGAAFDPVVRATVISAAGQDETDYDVGAGGSVKGFLLGDANEDGKVAASDLVCLRNYIGKNGEGMTVGAGADLSGDGTVNGLDLTALHRYFATTTLR